MCSLELSTGRIMPQAKFLWLLPVNYPTVTQPKLDTVFTDAYMVVLVFT